MWAENFLMKTVNLQCEEVLLSCTDMIPAKKIEYIICQLVRTDVDIQVHIHTHAHMEYRYSLEHHDGNRLSQAWTLHIMNHMLRETRQGVGFSLEGFVLCKACAYTA
jgi:hypothetical protein